MADLLLSHDDQVMLPQSMPGGIIIQYQQYPPKIAATQGIPAKLKGKAICVMEDVQAFQAPCDYIMGAFQGGKGMVKIMPATLQLSMKSSLKKKKMVRIAGQYTAQLFKQVPGKTASSPPVMDPVPIGAGPGSFKAAQNTTIKGT